MFYEYHEPKAVMCKTVSGDWVAGWAHGIFDGGLEGDICHWVLLDNGQWWQIPNPLVRGVTNFTAGREQSKDLKRKS